MDFDPAQNSRALVAHRCWAVVVTILLGPTAGCGWLWTSANPYQDWELLEDRCVTGPMGMQATGHSGMDNAQELASPQEFTVEEALTFYARQSPAASCSCGGS